VRGIFPQVQQQIPKAPPTATIVQIGDALELQMFKQLRRLRGKARLAQAADGQVVRQGMLLALVGAIQHRAARPPLQKVTCLSSWHL
jgi:hypothetical protein